MTEKRRKSELIIVITSAVLMLAAVVSVMLIYPELPKGFSAVAQTSAQETERLEVHFIDVGQGDCVLIKCGGEAMLIDSGENGSEQKVMNYLQTHGVDSLSYAVATHPHTDHIGAMPEIIDKYEIANFIMPRVSESLTPTNSTYEAFLTSLEASSAKVIAAKPGKAYSLGSASFKIIAPMNTQAESLNDISVVIRLDYGENSFLFTGDAGAAEENDILACGADIDCDILKVGHHGSSTSSKQKFLDAVSPETVVIMCGRDNSYGHPHQKVLTRIEKLTERIYRTDICSDIVITCDRQSYAVTFAREAA